jgi:5'-nucleotidase/UDP-sugar diphosphatase
MTGKLLLIGIVVGLCVALGIGLLESGAGTFELTLLHTNDVHSHYDASTDAEGLPVGGAARLATLVREIREEEPDTLLLDAGDQSQGTLYYNVGGADIVAAVMNAVGYDAMCVGNHEFDDGPSSLARLIDEANFPILSANIDAAADPDLAGTIPPFDVILVGDQTIGVFGLTAESTAYASSPGPNVTFTPTMEAAARVVSSLESQGIDKIIALTHLGYEEDVALGKAVAGIDVIVGGHSHTLLGAGETAEGPYPTRVKSPTGDPVVIVTDYEWGLALGRLDLIFDRRGVVRTATGQPIPIDGSIAEATDVLDILAPYSEGVDQLMAESVGETTVDLDGDRSAVRSRETNLGDFIADAMLWKTQALDADVAIQNGGGIRATLPAGEVSMGQILEVLPFGNTITMVEISGDSLAAALENGVSQVEQGAGRFPQVAGLRFTYDPSAEPGARVRSVEVWNPDTGAYKPLEPAQIYAVATNDFLATGGDGYDALLSETNAYETGWLVSDVTAEFLKLTSPISPQTEDRIQIVNDGEDEAAVQGD